MSEEWWILNKQEKTTEVIQWTPQRGGVVRARVDSITPWEYKKCGNAKYALSFGERIIQKQKQRKSL